LSLDQVAFFLRDEATGALQLYRMTGRQPAPDTWLDLRFLESPLDKPYLFFERPRHPIDVKADEWPSSVRASIAALDLTYYVPCTVRGRVIAWVATSRTDKGDFLSSDDLELLVTLAGSVGIAIENARLYNSLERKVDEYERLKEFSENIVESINVGILAADLDDRVESWNAEMERICGIARHQAVGRTLGELFPADLYEQFNAARQETGVRHLYKYTLRAGGSNGDSNGSAVTRELTLNLAVAPLFSRDARQIGRLVIFDDVTERAELEQRLVQADKLSSIGLLAAGVAHEVNTPLAVISTYAQMLAKQVSGDEQKSKLLDKIARQTFRASEIVNSLLNFSRTSSRDFAEVDLNRVIRETLQLIEHQLREARIEVDANLDATLPIIKGNAGRLQQVFLNLFLNARDAMEAGGGRLTIRSRGEDATIRLSISDTGHGIPAEQLTRIFDPFFTTKPGKKGTGLGLSVSYGIVQEHGGAIEVHSRPGEGTEFRLEFPLPASVRKPVHAG
jgi:PAS domain S-box-containing protein